MKDPPGTPARPTLSVVVATNVPATPYRLEEVPACTLCGSRDSRERFRVPPYGYRACLGCGLVRLSPRVTLSDLPRLYESLYRDYYSPHQQPLEEQLRNPSFAYRSRRLSRFARGPRLFEIGCGDGNFLAVMRALGWAVSGSEVNEAGARAARERHAIDVNVISFDSFQLPGDYEAVGMYHVLEHLYDPRSVLAAIRQALAPGGVFHLQVPNIRSIDGRLGREVWWGLRCPQHTYLYEPRHLRRLLWEEGFRVVSIDTYDPWHSPGTMELTLRTLLKRAYLHVVPTHSARLFASLDHRDQHEPDGAGEPALRSASIIGVRAVSTGLARMQSWLGLGNVADVVALAR